MKRVARAFVAVGSNIAPESNVPRALAMLRDRVDVVAVSPFYASAPVGTAEGGVFWNGVAQIETALSPDRVKEDVLRPIEQALGRVRTSDPNAPRTMDLDLILYADVIDRAFPLPDPNILRYAFVAKPLLDLVPDLVLPGDDAPLAARMPDAAALRRLPDPLSSR